MIDAANTAVILFDDECVLCNWSAHYIVKHDKKGAFRIGSLLSEKGKEILKEHNYHNHNESVVLLWQQRVYSKSHAVLKVLQLLGGVHKVAAVLYIIPAFIRDFFYDIVSKYRYKIFGRSNICE